MTDNTNSIDVKPVNSSNPGESEAARPTPNRQPLVDFEGAMLRLGGNMKLFREFIHILREDGPVLAEKIGAAINVSNSKLLEHSAHSLKGLVSNFGASDCVADAMALEKAGRAGDLAGSQALFERLMRNLDALMAELASYVD